MSKDKFYDFLDEKAYPSFNTIYLPTVPSCWEFGIQRHPRSLVPILDSLTPYKFLRGVQFDTKVFQLSELLSIVGAFNAPPTTEVILHPLLEEEEIRKALSVFQTTVMTKMIGSFPSFLVNMVKLNLPGVDEAFSTYRVILAMLAYDIRILPNWQDSMPAITLSHDWGAGDDLVTNTLSSINNIVTNVQSMLRSTGSPVTSIPYIRDRYKSSKMSEITIPILLFTKDNFQRDIFLPLMALLSISSAQSDKKLLNAVGECMLSVSGILKNKLDQALNSGGIIQTLAELAVVSADAARAAIGAESKTVLPPPPFKVTSTDGTINMSRGVIQQISYQFKGPYIKAGYKGLFGQLLSSIPGGTDIGSSVDRLLRDEYIKIFKFKDQGFPSICEVFVTLRETSFVDGDKYFQKIINPSVIDIINSGTNENLLSVQVASGIAQNIGVVLPETRGTGDLLGGGKWVPPGESLTGIPGFL